MLGVLVSFWVRGGGQIVAQTRSKKEEFQKDCGTE